MTNEPRTHFALDRIDFVVTIALALVVVAYVVLFFSSEALPHEDAAMIMRYSANIADGHGIRYNADEPPVDGATDFLFLVTVAGFVKTGLSLEGAVRFVGLLAHVFTVAIVYLGIRRLWGSSRWIAAASGLYIALGPGLGHVAALFGTTYFALFAALSWYYALRLTAGRGSGIAFAVSALAMGLTRPEGVLLAAMMLAAVVFATGWPRARGAVVRFVMIFGIIGAAYFAWRWSYFGYPLPNPFYIKGGGTLHVNGLVTAIKSTIFLSLPFLPIYAAALLSPQSRRAAFVSIIPVAGFTLIWVLLSDEMNYLRRFQYATLPIVLLSWPQLFDLLTRGRTWQPAVRAGLAVFLATSIAFGGTFWLTRKARKFKINSLREGRYRVAVMLSEYASRGYTMAVTEAGVLPLYSEWRAIDTYGLNDQWVAHNGLISAEYLDRYKPEVIMLHAAYALDDAPADGGVWVKMNQRLQEYAASNGYVTAAVFGETPSDVHVYYVRADFADSAEIARRIRDTDYTWYTSGAVCTNFASPH